MKRIFVSILILGAMGIVTSAVAKDPEITDPAEARKDPDFAFQGDYLGEASLTGESTFEVSAQAIARGKGKFLVVVYKGGLPGTKTWEPNEEWLKLKNGRKDREVLLEHEDKPAGKIVGDTLTIEMPEISMKLKRAERKSPTLGTKPPEGAVVLFDGTSADKFRHGRLAKDKNLLAEAVSKQKFGSYTLHLEFRLSYMPQSRGQHRSNSGVYLHDCYEIQVLDSFGLEGTDHECGGFYGIRPPDANMCYPPLTWQTYDVEFTAPKYQGKKKAANARVTVKHNGVVIHDNLELPHATPGRQAEGPAPRPIYLQGHGNKVQYRNIWLQEKKKK